MECDPSVPAGWAFPAARGGRYPGGLWRGGIGRLAAQTRWSGLRHGSGLQDGCNRVDEVALGELLRRRTLL